MVANEASGQNMREEHKNKDLHKSEKTFSDSALQIRHPSLIPKKPSPFTADL